MSPSGGSPPAYDSLERRDHRWPVTRSGLTEAPNAWWHHSALATELALRDAGQEYIYSIRELTKPRKIQQSMLERRGSHAEMDPGPRHDLSHLSSERFRRASRAVGCSKAVSRSIAGLDHQDRIHKCITERRLLCSTWQRWFRPRRSIAEATDSGETVLGVLSSDSVCAGATQGSLAHTRLFRERRFPRMPK